MNKRLWLLTILFILTSLLTVAFAYAIVEELPQQAEYYYGIGYGQASLSVEYIHEYEPDQRCHPRGGWAAPNKAILFLLSFGKYNHLKEMGWTFILDESEVSWVPITRIMDINGICEPSSD